MNRRTVILGVEALGIRQTPTFFLNRKRLDNLSLESLMTNVRVAVTGAP